MAKKQSRRSVSLSRLMYERLRSYCEVNSLSMSQFVEGRIGDFLGKSAPVSVSAPVVTKPVAAPTPVVFAPPTVPGAVVAPVVTKVAPVVAAPVAPVAPQAPKPVARVVAPIPAAHIPSAPMPGARPSVMKPQAPRQHDEAAARKAAERIFTF